MATTQVPPSGWTPALTGDVPAPAGASGVAGIRLVLSWSADRVPVSTALTAGGAAFSSMGDPVVAGETQTWSYYGPQQSVPAAVEASVAVTGAEMVPGTVLTVTAEGVEQFAPEGGLVPSGDPVELGTLEVVTWEEWRRLNGGD